MLMRPASDDLLRNAPGSVPGDGSHQLGLRHPTSPLPLLPSGPDGVHDWSSRRSRCEPPHLAERVGFEPTNTREDVTGIPVQRLRPLGHLSNQRLTYAFSNHPGTPGTARKTAANDKACRPGPHSPLAGAIRPAAQGPACSP